MKLDSKKNMDFIIIALIASLALLLLYQGINMDYKVEGGVINIEWFTGVDIPLADVEEVKVLDSLPDMQKIIGIEMGNIRQGTYSLEGIGRVKLYARNIKRKLVLIKTNSMVYGITPENSQAFMEQIAGR